MENLNQEAEVVETKKEQIEDVEPVEEKVDAESETENKDIVVFISGSTDVNEKDFMQYYFPILNSLTKVEQKIYFVMSDEDGVAVLTQMALNQLLKDKSVVSVFCVGEKPQNYVCSDYVLVPGFKTTEERDAAMTASSNKDLHIILGGKGTSGVEKNICRRLTPKYDYKKYLKPECNLPFWGILFNVITPEQIKKFQEQVLSESPKEENETTKNE